jgi:outer membrane protein OmpA-like peptidoglycan-associated protein
MPAKSNRLLMLLIGAAISGCASQTDRSSSSGSDRYQPEKESVQLVDRPLESAPPPKPAPVAAAPKPEAVPENPPPPKPAPVAAAPKNEAVPEFPVTKYELPEEQDEEVQDLGPQEDESVSAEQEAVPAGDSSVGETTEYADTDEAEEVEELGVLEDESTSAEQEPSPAAESSVGETTEYAENDESDEMEELGPQEDESISAEQDASPVGESSVGETTEYAESDESDEMEELGPQEDESSSAAQEPSPAGESTVGATTEYADQEETEVVEDLGTQPDESGTVHYPEEKLAAADRVVGEPKVYAEETTPKPKAAPAAPRSVSVSFESEPLFGFDKSVITADGKSRLDELISSLGGVDIESISVVGHADRIGAKAYNQKLSERRAAAVNKYLSNKGIPTDRIHTEGRGQSEPVSGDACNKVRGKKLIVCLQPDRRVEVNVTATKQKQ